MKGKVNAISHEYQRQLPYEKRSGNRFAQRSTITSALGMICLFILLTAIVFPGSFKWQNFFPAPPGSSYAGSSHLVSSHEVSQSIKWGLAFDDEFTGSTIAQRKWNIENMGHVGYQNCCLGYGLQYFTPNALSLVNGSLQITTKNQTVGRYKYTSGAITTENKFSFLYGRIDFRAKLPRTQGLWPAIWLLPNGSRGNASFEIDVMELLGQDPTTVHMTNHWGKKEIYASYKSSDFSRSYHVFSMIWLPQSITWYVDGAKAFQTSKGISNKQMYLIINSSIGGAWVGPPNRTTVLPQLMNIDYVRIYKPLSK